MKKSKFLAEQEMAITMGEIFTIAQENVVESNVKKMGQIVEMLVVEFDQ